MIKKVVLAVFILSVICLGSAFASDGAIGHLYEGKSPVKVYIIGVKNESGQSQLSADVYRKNIEDSLNNRKSTDFDIVANQADSDIQVSAVIKDYKYKRRQSVYMDIYLQGFLYGLACLFNTGTISGN